MIIENVETLEAVHTHTHTEGFLNEKYNISYSNKTIVFFIYKKLMNIS